MGYGLHITRKQEWSQDGGDVIELAEWLGAVAQLGGLHPIAEAQLGDTALKLPEEWHSHRWSAHPEHRGTGPIFELSNGNVNFGATDTASLHFALRLAAVLRARIVGDEGEEYTLSSILGPEDESGWKAKNPFTNQPIYRERDGILEKLGEEWRLVTSKHARGGIRRAEERALLYFIEPLPGNPVGRKICVRGTISDPGEYGSDRSCRFVFYVLKVVAISAPS
jgi:hypothetical protein